MPGTNYKVLTPGHLTFGAAITAADGIAENGVTLSAVHTGDVSGTNTVVVNKYDALGNLANSIISAGNVTSGSNANLLAGVEVLPPGHSLKARNTTGGNATKYGNEQLPEAPTALLVNSAGTTLMCVLPTYGIYRTTDGGANWTRVYTGAVSCIAAYRIDGATEKFYFLTSTTAALKSTNDGATFAAAVLVNGPSYASAGAMRVKKVGTAYYGVNAAGTKLVTSPAGDGETWTDFGVVIPAGTIRDFDHTGTNWVLASGNAAGTYYSADALAWTAVALTGAVAPTLIVSNRAGVVATGIASGALFYSTNNGTSYSAMTSQLNAAGAYWTGLTMVLGSTTGGMGYVDPSVPTVLRTKATCFGATANCAAVGPSKVYYAGTQLCSSFSLDMSAGAYGVTLSWNYQENIQ